MRAKQLIEKLEDLATYFALKRKEAHQLSLDAKAKGDIKVTSYWAGDATAYGLAFLKVDSLIKEAKR